MIIKQDLVKRIKDHFDLNVYETKVWLALLSKGVVSAGETAELSGVPRSRTYDILESLEKKGFIARYTISIDWKKLGYEWYGLQFNLTKFGEDIEMKLKDYLNNHKKVILYNRYLGGAWDYDIGILIKNSNELREFINELRSEFSNEIKITDVFLILEETTGYKMPEGVFK